MSLETYYRTLLHNEKGELVKDSGLIESHSYVIQFLEWLEAFMDGETKSATDVDGAETAIITSSDDVSKTILKAGAGLDPYGIVVGTNAGTTAEDNENYALDTKILHSAVGAAGCLNYQAVTTVAPVANGGNVDFDITRTFLNETGVTITVKEIGLILWNWNITKYHLLLRDVVSDEAVLDDYTLTVVYTLRTTV